MAQGSETPAAPPQEPEGKRKKLLVIVVVAAIVLATIGIAAVFLATSRPPSRTLDRAEVTPPDATIVLNGIKAYTVRAYDGTGALIVAVALSVQWTVTPASLGTLDATTGVSVVFTGRQLGSGTITAQVTWEGQTKSGSATISVIPEPDWATAMTLTLPATASVGRQATGTVAVLNVTSQPYAAYRGTVRFTAAPAAGATLPADYSFVAGDAGTHDFTNGFEFAAPGTYLVTVRDAVNGTLTGSATVQVNPLSAPVASATATTNQYAVTFDGTGSTDADGTIVSYAWDFGDLNTGTGATVTHTYAGTGTYSATLTVTDNDALTDVAALTVSLFPPTAAFISTPAGMRVDVDASASVDSDGTIVSYSWDWGDGTPAGNGVIASHTYAAEGSFTIVLSVTDDDSFVATASRTVDLFRPTASFTASISMDTVSVDASASTDDGTIVSYSWDWGDATLAGSGVTASHAYATGGAKTITLTVTDDVGLQGSTTRSVTPRFAPVACFSVTTNLLDASTDASCTTDVDANIVSYSWDWGDATPAGSGVTAIHTYSGAGTYTITLNVTDADGFWDVASRDVTVSGTLIRPNACFDAVVNGALDRLELDATCASDPDGTIVSYSWDWGDATPAGGGVTATHAYAAPGTYLVNLTVTDDDALVNWTTRSVSWFPPSACFLDSSVGYAVDVDASCSSDPDGTIVSYSWDWGDGTPAGNGLTASHTYLSPAVYTVILTVTDADGFARSTSSTISLFPPEARFTVRTAVYTITVDATASFDPDGTIVSYSWDWGDATPAGSGVTASHTYATAGRYTVILSVTDDGGFVATAQNDVSVNATTLDFTFYDFFNVSLDTWWTNPQQRQRVYGDEVLNNAYPYLTWYPWAGDRRDPTIYSMYRMYVEGNNLPGYSIDDPVILPRFGPDQPGGSAQIDLYMQYVSDTRRTQLSAAGCFINQGSMDGFIIEVQGTYKMDTSTSRELFNVVGDPTTWWAANTLAGCANYGAFETAYEDWLIDQGNVVYDIYNAFEYTFSPWYTDITATVDALNDTVTVTVHFITWGGEVLYARWFYWGTTDYVGGTPAGWWGQELGWFEDWTFNATIATDMDFRLRTALAYQFNNVGTVGPDNTWNTADDNSSWVWEPMLMDYLYASAQHTRSELTPYAGRLYVHSQVGSIYYGQNYVYEYVPITWNLKLGESWTFIFPAGNVWFYNPFTSGETSLPGDLVHYAAPMTFGSVVPSGLGSWNPASRTYRLVGPTNIAAPPNPDFGQPLLSMGPA